MSTIQYLFEQAQLAEAAYADLSSAIGNKAKLQESLDIAFKQTYGGSFSQAQAIAFADQWEVIDHIPDTAAGFSATIFKNRQTGAYSLAIRGSTDLADFYADALLIARDGVAVRQIADLYNYWQRSTTASGLTYDAAQVVPYPNPLNPDAIPVGNSGYGIVFKNSAQLDDAALRTGTGVIPAGLSAINVAGHSLGGHLTMAFTRLFPALETDALGINGLGFKLGNSTTDSLFSILGGPNAYEFTSSEIQNFYGIAGPEFAAMDNGILQQPGGFDGIYIESGGFGTIGGHSATQMTDSAALYSLYAKFSPNLTLEQITTLLKSASPAAGRSLEYALDAMRTVLLGKNLADADPTKHEGTDARDSLYRNLKSLQDNTAYRTLTGNAPLRLTAEESADSLAQKAKNDFGWFLAVQELLPIAIEGSGSVLIGANPDLYGRWSTDLTKRIDGSTDLEFSDAYIGDRATMLAWWMVGNVEDRGYGPITGGENWQFVDVTSNKAAYALSTASAIDAANAAAGDPKRLAAMFDEEMKRVFSHRVGFGGDGSDHLAGGALDDRLYGMAGQDVLQGLGGNDWIEGGRDNDILIGGTGDDDLLGGEGRDLYYYRSGDGNDRIIDVDGGLLVVHDEMFDLYANGYFAKKDGVDEWTRTIKGTDNVERTVTLTHNGPWRLVLGDGATLDLGESADLAQFGIVLGDAPATAPTEPTLVGDRAPKEFNAHFTGEISSANYGSDWVNIVETVTQSHIDQGATIVDAYDVTYKKLDANFNYVTEGDEAGRNDSLRGSDGTDYIQSKGGDDEVSANGGNDRVEGGTGADRLRGGSDDDILLGGADSDILFGDGGKDTLFADTDVPLDQAYALGESQALVAGRGEFLDGGAGNDILIGSAAADFLEGGAGADDRRSDRLKTDTGESRRWRDGDPESRAMNDLVWRAAA